MDAVEHAADEGVLIDNNHVIKTLLRALSDAPRDVNILIEAMREALARKAWVDRLDRVQGRIQFQPDAFEEFVTRPEQEGGLGKTIEQLKKWCSEANDLLDAFDRLTQRTPGGNNPSGVNQHSETSEVDVSNGNVNQSGLELDRPAGNTKQYAVRKLRKEAEKENASEAERERYQRLVAGEITANAAMVEAGYRRVPTPFEIGKKAWFKMSPEQRTEFLAWLYTPGANPESQP